ncbi:MAG: SDR family NAD(P)-dependent oxidoreductase, partial [Gammaproteobacteria bacterium]|nr:SDR family NAD(P)-dependent oxidoreductase [Gammaproteobacteria bacterium]
MAGLLQDKAIIITGGSTGIGRATALRAAQEGAKLIIADVNVQDGEAVTAEIKAAGGVAQFVRTDVTVTAQVQAMIAASVSAYG